MKFSFANRGCYQTSAWITLDLPWEQICQIFSEHKEVGEDKNSAACFTPSALKVSPGPRNNENTDHFSAFVGDFDDITAEQAAKIIEDTNPYARIIYTTHGYYNGVTKSGPKTARFRIILPFSRQVSAADFPRIWKAASNWLGCVDPVTKDLARFFFTPSHAPGKPWLPVFIGQGVFLDPTALRSKPVTKEALNFLAQKLKRKTDPTLGIALKYVVDGQPYADPGNRDNMAFTLCRYLVDTFPDASPQNLASFFAHSSADMGEDAPNILDKLERLYQRKTQLPDIRTKHIREHFNSHGEPGREDPWISDELDEIRQQGPWIVNVGTQYYFLGRDGYSRGYVPNEASICVYHRLSPSDIQFEKDDKLLPLQVIARTEGVTPKRLIYDMTARKSSYDDLTGTFRDATCPIRPIGEVYSEQVNRWLELTFHKNVHLVNRWLALLSDIQHTCAALLITGPPGTGKTLLAFGCSRLWREYGGPTPMGLIFGKYNAALAQCPLVLADEMLPEGPNGRPQTLELRELIGTNSRILSKKFALEESLHGAPRVIITANSESILQINENLNQDDSAAIAERILHIPASEDGRKYLESLGQERVARFVNHDELAAHALYLSKNLEFQREGRFQIKAPSNDLVERLTVSSGVKGLICKWCVWYLANYLTHPQAPQMALVKDGNLYVNGNDIVKFWSVPMGRVFEPRDEEISKALRGLSSGGIQHRKKRFRRINLNYLRIWAENNDWDPDLVTPRQDNDPLVKGVN